MPYWPAALSLICTVPPTLTQLTEAGFAMPASPAGTVGAVGTVGTVWEFAGAALPVPEGAVGTVGTVGTVWEFAGAAGVAVVDGTDEVDCWVQPAIRRPAPMQRHRARITKDFGAIMMTGEFFTGTG